MKLLSLGSVAALVLTGCGSSGQVGPLNVAAPRYEFSNVVVDASCSEPYWRAQTTKYDTSCGGLFDHCIRAHINVESLADKAQDGSVSATYFTPDGKEVKKSQLVHLGPKSTETVIITFEEASIGDSEPRVQVAVDTRSCARVKCSVMNTGDAAGAATVRGNFRDQSRTDSINLAPGQTRDLTFDFQDVIVEGEGSCQLQE